MGRDWSDEAIVVLAGDVCWLASCVLRGEAPHAERVARLDWRQALEFAEGHQMEGIVAMALRSAGIRDAAIDAAEGNAVRKAVLVAADRRLVMDALDEAGICHMALKGSVLEGLYPAIGARQMGDVDVLVDPRRLHEARQVMEKAGFTTTRFGIGCHDNYYKRPLSFFELHKALFIRGEGVDALETRYADVWTELAPREGTRSEFAMSDEQFYVYMVAHAYKHFTHGGTGLRTLMDVDVFLQEKRIDWRHVRAELRDLGLAEFEREMRHAARGAFGHGEATAQDITQSEGRELIVRIARSGAYGNAGSETANAIEAHGGGMRGRLAFVAGKLLPSCDVVRERYPFFWNHKWLLPVFPAWHVAHCMTKRRERVASQLGVLLSFRDTNHAR